MLNKKNIFYHDNKALAEKLAAYSPLFAKKLNTNVALVLEASVRNKNDNLYFIKLKKPADLAEQPNRAVIASCNMRVAENKQTGSFIYEISLMDTSFYQKQGVQTLLQAVLCDIFEIEEMHFKSTSFQGSNYVNNNPLFHIRPNFSDYEGAPDIICDVDLPECLRLIEKNEL